MNPNVIHQCVKDTLIEFAKEFCDYKERHGFNIVPVDDTHKEHGNCCYCQTCGFPHDNECVCEHNRIVKWIKSATGL